MLNAALLSRQVLVLEFRGVWVGWGRNYKKTSGEEIFLVGSMCKRRVQKEL